MESITLPIPPHIPTPVPSDTPGSHSLSLRLRHPARNGGCSSSSRPNSCYSVLPRWGVGRGCFGFRSPPPHSVFAPRCAYLETFLGGDIRCTSWLTCSHLRFSMLMAVAIPILRRGLHRQYRRNSVFVCLGRGRYPRRRSSSSSSSCSMFSVTAGSSTCSRPFSGTPQVGTLRPVNRTLAFVAKLASHAELCVLASAF